MDVGSRVDPTRTNPETETETMTATATMTDLYEVARRSTWRARNPRAVRLDRERREAREQAALDRHLDDLAGESAALDRHEQGIA
jgi:hypothetical protein